MLCATCQGTNQIDAEYHRRITVGLSIRNFRVSEGITLRKAAELLGCSPVSMSNIERGRLVSQEDYAAWNRITNESLTFSQGGD